ncbi:hypothetical protein GEMRC1_004690 [Eukaryota sp. GEM-RC1]
MLSSLCSTKLPLFTNLSAQKTAVRTPLYDIHKLTGGDLVPFAGYELPSSFPTGIKSEIQHCRSKASLFDVSHMGQILFSGADRFKFFEQLTPVSISDAKANQAKLTCLTSEKGTIYDDLMVTKRNDHLFTVVNGACKDKDLAIFRNHLSKNPDLDVSLHVLDNALLALQGPVSQRILQKHVNYDLSKQSFMTQKDTVFTTESGIGIPITITRCGYTGEEHGFELSVPKSQAITVASCLLASPEVKPAGLGARDTLRLEAGLCLYGNDMDETTTLPEAGLSWFVSKKRRESGGFPGHSEFMNQIKNGVQRKRVGLRIRGPPARDGASLFDQEGNVIGKVTSGTFSPTLKAPIAMGYVDRKDLWKIGSEVFVEIRGKKVRAEVVKTPFIPTNYYRG